MALFRSKSAGGSSSLPISEFWKWWNASAGTELAVAIDAGDPTRFVKTITKLVKAIDQGLAWEMGPGTESTHQFVVSAEGVPERRAIAERWLRAAPAPTAAWQFQSSRQAEPAMFESSMNIANHVVDLASTRFSVAEDLDRARVDVTCFNPAFASLPQDVQLQIAFLALDWALGEDQVERWIGEIAVASTNDDHGLRYGGLSTVVDDFATERAESPWAVIGWKTKAGQRGIARVRRIPRWIDLPTLDMHTSVRVAYVDQDGDGFPGPASFDLLEDLEDQLESQLGTNSIFIGHETTNGIREFHVYTDSEDQNATDRVRDVAAALGGTVTQERDPGWKSVRRFTS